MDWPYDLVLPKKCGTLYNIWASSSRDLVGSSLVLSNAAAMWTTPDYSAVEEAWGKNEVCMLLAWHVIEHPRSRSPTLDGRHKSGEGETHRRTAQLSPDHIAELQKVVSIKNWSNNSIWKWFVTQQKLNKLFWAQVVGYKKFDSSMFRRGREMQRICSEDSVKKSFHEKW